MFRGGCGIGTLRFEVGGGWVGSCSLALVDICAGAVEQVVYWVSFRGSSPLEVQRE